MLEFTGVFICVIIVIAFLRSVTVLLHELGHALPAIILTKEKVTVFVGSFGNTKNSFCIRLGLLEIWMLYTHPWNKGVCIPSKLDSSIRKKFIYILLGPLTSIVSAAIGIIFIYVSQVNDILRVIIILFSASALLDFCISIIPHNAILKLHNGSATYNDGYQLNLLCYMSKFPKKLEAAILLLNEKKYQQAAVKFKYFLSRGLKGESLYRFAIFSFIQSKEYERALTTHKLFELNYGLNADDYTNSGLIKARLELQTESFAEYEKALSINPDNHIALNNIGYHLNLMEQYIDAIPVFNRALKVDPNFAYSYSNRGLAKIKLGQTDEGLKDIEFSLELDPEDAFAYKNLGIYHLDKNEISQAVVCFNQAKKLDANTHGIDKLIEEASLKKRSSENLKA